jgi:hypothetical protein
MVELMRTKVAWPREQAGALNPEVFRKLNDSQGNWRRQPFLIRNSLKAQRTEKREKDEPNSHHPALLASVRTG